MTEFFGIPMNVVLVAMLILLAAVLASVWWVRQRHRIVFDIGVRNIPRRRAQSALIVVGLMLSTVIFSAALTIGDTIAHSITNDAYEKLGHVDEIVQARSNSRTPSFEDEDVSPIDVLRPRDYDALAAEFNGDPNVDGLLSGLRFPAPVTNFQTRETEPVAVVMGLDPGGLAGFEEDVRLVTGELFDVRNLARAEVLANESLARKLDLSPGQNIDVWINALPRTLRVVGIVQDRYLTGWTLAEPEGFVINLDEALVLFDLPTGAGTENINSTFVAISNKGGVRDSLQYTDSVTQSAIDALRTSRTQVVAIKADRVDRAQETGANLTAIFIVLGLFTIAAGVLLVFLILVMLAAERRSEMGMSRAVGMSRGQLVESFMAEGMAYSLVAATLGAALGVIVSLSMTRAMQYVFSAADVDVSFHVEWRSLLIAFTIGVVITYATLVFSAWRVSRLSIVAAIRDVDEPAPRVTGRLSLIAGIALLAGGAVCAGLGLSLSEGYLLGLGISAALIGAGFAARSRGMAERPAFTAVGLLILAGWVLLAGDTLGGDLSTGIETFFVGGVMMVAAATFVAIYNADILLGAVRGVGVVFARAVPAVRTAIAYPLASKLRTGMTIAMLSLVVFALVMISIMSLNFRELFLDPGSRGGWDIELATLPTNSFPTANEHPLGPLGDALDRGFYDIRSIDAVAEVLVSNPRRTEVRQLDDEGNPLRASAIRVMGADDTFLDQNQIRLQARATGYTSDTEIWDAVKNDPNNAVIDGSVVPGINYANIREDRFTLQGFESGTTSFAPFSLLVRDSATDEERPVRIIGIMERGPSETFRGLWLSAESMAATFAPLNERYFVRLLPGRSAEIEAAAMEDTLSDYGVSARSIDEHISEQQSINSAFFVLIQGFLAIGLGVGLVALAVIALRTVVERRQQIGLLRAIGFSRSSIAWWFVLESAFIAIIGIVNGIWPALLLSNRLLASDEFSTAGFQSFHVPWLQIALVAAGVFAVSVLTTVIPSRQAAAIPPAEALRYE